MKASPCPFCGESNVSVAPGETQRWCKAVCNECGAQAGEVRVPPRKDEAAHEWVAKCRQVALEAWNDRASL